MDQGASTCLGVGKDEIHLKTPGNICKSEDMYLYRSFQGMLYSEGKELSRRFEEFWPSGTLVEMIVDIKENEGSTVCCERSWSGGCVYRSQATTCPASRLLLWNGETSNTSPFWAQAWTSKVYSCSEVPRHEQANWSLLTVVSQQKLIIYM